MTAILKQRLVGAIVLISLGIIFIPMLLTGTDGLTTGEIPTNIPPKPLYEIQAPAVLPLEQKDLPEPVLEPIPEPAAASKDDQQKPQALVKPDSVKDKGDVAVIETPDTDKKTATVTETKPASKTTTVAASAKPEKTQPVEQETTSKPAAKTATASTTTTTTTTPTTTAKVETAKPVAKPAVKQPIVSGWVVQLGSFSVEKNALKLRDKLRKNGHASFVEAYERNGKTSYRVRVGPELTRELAGELKIKLKKETRIDGLVMAFPGK
ncbi:SPOR domain-containing protein [Kaarinaea lacus]